VTNLERLRQTLQISESRRESRRAQPTTINAELAELAGPSDFVCTFLKPRFLRVFSAFCVHRPGRYQE